MYRLHRSAGFTYIGLLIFIAILGTATAATLQVGSLLQRRAAEDDLLAIGREWRQALISYAHATPVGQSPLPSSIEDLLKDPRYPGVRRHLRRIYRDPITHKLEWGIVRAPNGNGVVGVHSLSEAQPLKIGNFPSPFQAFEKKMRYQDWIFTGMQ